MSVLDVVEFVSGLDLEFHVHNRVLVSQHRSVGHRLVSVDAACLRNVRLLARVRLTRSAHERSGTENRNRRARRGGCPVCGQGQRLTMDITAALPLCARRRADETGRGSTPRTA